MKRTIALIVLLAASVAVTAQSQTPAATGAPAAITVRELRYEASLADHEARIVADVDAECAVKTGGSLLLFEGDVAVMPPKLPDQLTLIRDGNRYSLSVPRAGRFKFKLEFVAKIQRAEPWNQVSFTGPSAAIASIVAQARSAGMEVQLLNGTVVESSQTNGLSRVRGLLGAERAVALRWQGKVTEVARKALITADTTVSAQITPTVIKYTTQIRYDILQGAAPRLTLALPAAHALTRLVGEQIRDWQLKPEGERQVLTVEFIKPPEKSCTLTLYSEQTVEAGAPARLDPPQPLEIEREAGSLTLSAEDMVAETDSLTGLRQVNATAGALAAYRFNGRPFTLALKLKRIEPVLTAADRVTTRLEETRLLISHSLTLEVEKAGIYAVELMPQVGLTVAEVRGEGIEDWKVSEGKLKVNFSARVLGSRKLDVQLEQALKTFPEQFSVTPLRVTGATKESAQVGAASAPGIRLKTGELVALREIPVSRLTNRSDELLAYTADQPDWKLALASERLAARLVADVFNLVTIGDGLVGGSATIRYSIGNQGVQEFRVKLPPHCKNVEFTGPNIRRKELAGEVWTIGLQDKAWGGYTLVVTYDFPFGTDSADARAKGETLAVGGIHAVNVERETGSIALTTAASLKLSARTASDSVRRVEESELAATDRALITRAVVLAYQYTGDQYELAVDVQRHDEVQGLDAVADRTQITSVLTEAGEMLTQASFMVKNNAKQFQRFELPPKANLWGCYVNGQPAKPERDGAWVLVPLPREVNRDQAFAVDIVYAQTNSVAKTHWSRPLQLAAPRTDVPNTYAEWQLYVPATLRLSAFGGSMAVAQGTTYDMLDAWRKFLAFYADVLRELGPGILIIGGLALLAVALVVWAARRGASGVIELLVVVAILAVLGAMLLPALGKAKAKSQRINTVNNLKQIGLAARMFAGDNGDKLPVSFEEMMNELNTDKVTYDVETGQRLIYLGAGMQLESLAPDSVLAYSPIFEGHCNVLFADGSVAQMNAARFSELSRRGLVRHLPAAELAARQQSDVVRNVQQMAAPVAVPQPAPQTIQPLPKPLARGLRSIRIELPREGNAFLFTKVLNLGDVPLTVRARVMSLEVFRNVQMAGQVAAFLAGLAVWWWQWRRTHRNSFILTCALALILGSVSSLLVAWRAMHDALIIGFPIVVLGGVAWMAWKWQARRKANAARKAVAAPSTGDNLPPALATTLLVLGLFVANASADEDMLANRQSSIAALASAAANLKSEISNSKSGKRTPKSKIAADSKSAIHNPQSAIGSVSVLSAGYTGSVNDRVAQIEATLRVATAQPDQLLPLFGEDVAIQQFIVKSGDAKLVREGNGVGVRLGKRGEVVLQVRFVTKIGGDVTKRRLGFAIPPALTTQVALVVDQPDADVDFPTAISVKRTTEAEKTRVEAIIGSGERVELLWTPRVKRAAEVAATLFCQNTSLATVGGGVVSVRSVLDYQVTQGELRQARVRLPAGQRLLRVEGDGIRTWELKDENGGQTLVVELLKGVAPAYRLTLETEKALDALPATAVIETPHALDVKRESGLVALRGAEELTLSVETARELQRVDAEEFARAGTLKADGLCSVFRFLKPEFELRARAETVQPQIEAAVRNYTRVAADQVSLAATMDYTIKRAGVFVLRLALPADYRVEQVTSTNLQQWTERTDGGPRLLEVTLKERTLGACSLRVELAKHFKELPKSLRLEGVQPLDTAKLTGFVSAVAEAGVALKTEAFDGLTELPAVSLPDAVGLGGTAGVLAFKFITTDSSAAQLWKLSVTTEAVEPWVRAEIVNTLTLTEPLVSGRALVRYDIANAPVKQLCLRIPETFRNVELSGPNIRRRDQRGEIWCVELQSKTRGAYTLTVTWEQPRAKTNRVELAGVSADGVERETGLVAIVARPPLQVSELARAELNPVDAGEFPEWAGRPDQATVLAYRYARPAYRLALEARRFDEAEVLQALADSVRLITVVADDGQAMTEMSLSVRNNGRQFLEVELPAGVSVSNVWSAFVAGQPVRPSLRDGKLLLPLQEWGADEETVSVELTYVGTNAFPRARGKLGFVSPKFDVPLRGAQWEVYLPPDYRYEDFAGTMTREVATTPSLWSFGLSEYLAMEKKGKAAYKAEVQKDVSRAQSNLSSGNVREAVGGYYRAKGRKIAGESETADVKQLEQQLRNAQAGNLLKAQQDFTLNNGVFAPQQTTQTTSQSAANYDNATAEAQWTKLAQAQEIAVARVQPLHVNLPLRGLRYAFTQVLQTEINKPMTIELSATNTKTGHWLKRIGLGAVGFVALWAVVSVVAARKRA